MYLCVRNICTTWPLLESMTCPWRAVSHGDYDTYSGICEGLCEIYVWHICTLIFCTHTYICTLIFCTRVGYRCLSHKSLFEICMCDMTPPLIDEVSVTSSQSWMFYNLVYVGVRVIYFGVYVWHGPLPNRRRDRDEQQGAWEQPIPLRPKTGKNSQKSDRYPIYCVKWL